MYKISVIIPVYNVEDYIEETIESLLGQTLKDFEVIFIDDGSTDKSVDKIKKYLENNNNFRLIVQSNSGPGKARNKGLEEAKGEYIVFMDSDDLIPNNSLEIRYELASDNNAEMVVGATYGYDGVNKWPIMSHFSEEGIKNIKNSKELFQSMGPCNKIFKKSLIEDIKFPEDVKYGEDQVFVMNSYIRSKRIYKTNENIYYYRQRNSDLNPSLTDLEVKKPNYILEQVLETWIKVSNCIDNNCEGEYLKKKLKLDYLERLVGINIWPPFKNAIINGNEEIQIKAIKCMDKILDNTEEYMINSIEKFRWISIQGIIDKYLFLKGEAKSEYIKYVSKAINRLDQENIDFYKVKGKLLYNCIKRLKLKSSKYIVFKYLVLRKVSRIKNALNRRTKMVFSIAKLLPIKNNMVILASNKSEKVTGNLKFIKKELERVGGYNIKEYPDNPNRSFIECIKMYINFARAKYIVLDDYYRQLYGLKFKSKAQVIQVWHACGAFKKFGFSAIGKEDGNTLEFEKNAHSHYTKVITSSENIIDEYSEAFNISKDKVLPLGVPRTDYLFNKEYINSTIENLKKEYENIEGKKVILYAPTFRGGLKERQSFKLKLDPIKILKEIGEDYIIMLKLHPSVKNGLKNVVIPDYLKDRVINVESSKDINDLIILSDIVITDYSSVIFEAAILNKKIIMYAYDKEEYLGERDFYYDYDNFVPGIITKSNEEIIDVINNEKFDSEKVKNFKEKFFDHSDGQATKRFVETIFNR